MPWHSEKEKLLGNTARFQNSFGASIDQVHGKSSPSGDGEHRCPVVPQVQLRRKARGGGQAHLI